MGRRVWFVQVGLRRRLTLGLVVQEVVDFGRRAVIRAHDKAVVVHVEDEILALRTRIEVSRGNSDGERGATGAGAAPKDREIAGGQSSNAECFSP